MNKSFVKKPARKGGFKSAPRSGKPAPKPAFRSAPKPEFRAEPKSDAKYDPVNEPAPEPVATPMSAVQMLVVTADEDGMRLDRWFKRRVPDLSLGHLNKIVRTGQVRVDGGRVQTSTRLTEGVTVRVPPLQTASSDGIASPAVKRPVANEADARTIKQMILFEDKHVMVLNKPYGLAVQGGSGTTRHIDGMLMGMVDEKGDRPLLVHRLDRDTSGVLLVAKTRKMASDLGELFRSRQARKIYWAIVEGVPKPSQGRISLFLAKGAGMGDVRGPRRFGEEPEGARKDPEKMRVARHGEEDAQHSITYYATVDKVAPRLAWLSMKPVTGRTHQLRAHAEAIGHPIIGDPKYGHRSANDPRRTDPLRAIPDAVEDKLHLLARRLILPHPKGGTIDVTAPLPPHMKTTFDMFGFDVKSYDPIEDAPEE
ncbi:MAG: pseudouridine synthase, RluA family [Hyphomicrobiales bacterium]|nr:pseudouridine synthase, RluA family [Hyphomicrobiales bacterium]